MQGHTYILKWRHGSSPEVRWFLRGIGEDGSFYGEVLCGSGSPQIIDGKPANGAGNAIQGTLSPADCSRFHELVADIGSAGAEPIDGWTGLLAEGPITAPRIRFYYVPGAEKTSGDAARFLAVVELLAEYIRPSCIDVISTRNTQKTSEETV